MTKRVFIIHGYGGIPDIGWKLWLKQQLESAGIEVHAPTMPDTHHPRVGPWVQTLAEVVGTPGSDCIFVGHSLGCITILRYLETLKPEIK